MANAFKRKLSRNVGTSEVTIGGYTVGAGVETTIIGLTVANVRDDDIKIDVYINDGTNNTHLVKQAQVLEEGTIVIVGGDAKVILEPGDSVRIKSDYATSADVVMSILEIS